MEEDFRKTRASREGESRLQSQREGEQEARRKERRAWAGRHQGSGQGPRTWVGKEDTQERGREAEMKRKGSLACLPLFLLLGSGEVSPMRSGEADSAGKVGEAIVHGVGEGQGEALGEAAIQGNREGHWPRDWRESELGESGRPGTPTWGMLLPTSLRKRATPLKTLGARPADS